jgi:hypothetical protein
MNKLIHGILQFRRALTPERLLARLNAAPAGNRP